MKTKGNLLRLCLLAAVLLQALTSGAQPVTKIAAGQSHSLFLKGDGSLWAMGNNQYGQLGDSTYNNTNRPEKILDSGVAAIAAGEGGGKHSLFLKNDGSLWAMGDNSYGQLGDGTTNNINHPEQIVASNVIAIAAGWHHSLFLKTDGSLWAMGNNTFNWSAGTYIQTNTPQLIIASNVTAIAAGEYHSLFLKNDGSLWAMGNNYWGQLGDGRPLFYDESGLTYFLGTNSPEMIVASNVTAIAAGYYVSFFFKSDGSLWGMGENSGGALGDGNDNFPGTNQPEQLAANNVRTITGGGLHSLFIKNNGSLWAMGDNYSGQLGDGTTDNGAYFITQPEQIVSSNVTAIAAGSIYSLFLKSDGSLWAMGDNTYGQLGDGTYNQTNLPVQILAAYNQISGQPLSGGNMQLSFVGIAGTNYALDRSFSLNPPNWLPQVTNPANSFGALIFTNTPNPATNNFWRIRSVP